MEKKLLDIIDKYFSTLENTGMIDRKSANKIFKAFSLYELLAHDIDCLSNDQKKLIKKTIECLLDIECFKFAKISFCQADVDPITSNHCNTDVSPKKKCCDNAVLFTPQNLTEEQKEQARLNIGAESFSGDYNDLINKPFYDITLKVSENSGFSDNVFIINSSDIDKQALWDAVNTDKVVRITLVPEDGAELENLPIYFPELGNVYKNMIATVYDIGDKEFSEDEETYTVRFLMLSVDCNWEGLGVDTFDLNTASLNTPPKILVVFNADIDGSDVNWYDAAITVKMNNGGSSSKADGYPQTIDGYTRYRTLLQPEFDYILNTRPGVRYFKACVEGVNGLVILPDNNFDPSEIPGANDPIAAFDSNIISKEEWYNDLEQVGYIFLPCAGQEWRGEYMSDNQAGFYRTASIQGTNDNNGWTLVFSGADVSFIQTKVYGASVRLVTDTTSNDGYFTINSNGDKIKFTRGNLQYNEAMGMWRFAEDPWKYCGIDNGAALFYDGLCPLWTDLFSIYNYQWDGADPTQDLVGNNAKADWGVWISKVPFSGSYNELTDKPTIPAAQIQSDWNQTDDTQPDFIKNKPEATANMIEVTWEELVELRDNGELLKGTYYRITDYNFVTTKINVQSGNHQFDIVVLAISESMLSENAMACAHAGDTYFRRQVLVGGIEWLYTVYVDDLGSGYGLDPVDHSEDLHASDSFCDSGTEEHPITGIEVPVLYKTDTDQYDIDDPDYDDRYYYEGTYTLDGVDYDMWSKYEYDADNDEWNFARQYALTPIVVEDGELVVPVIPEVAYVPTNMNSWELKYCLDNDKDLFDWAVTSGKGVIYWMRDEFGNEAPYDFKNVMFRRKKIISVGNNILNNFINTYAGQDDYYQITCGSDSKFLYTFNTAEDDTDGSLSGICNYNTILPYILDGKRTLNDIVINNATNNYISNNCYNITLFGSSTSNNTIGSYSCNITMIGAGNNKIDEQFRDNTFYTFSGNTVGTSFSRNFGAAFQDCIIGKMCQNNNFGSNTGSSSFGIGCSSNTFGSFCYGNTFGNSVTQCTFGNYCSYNSFDGQNSSISFTNYYRFNTVEVNVNRVALNTSGGGVTNYVQNVKICKGINNYTVAPTRGISYETIYYKNGRVENAV